MSVVFGVDFRAETIFLTGGDIVGIGTAAAADSLQLLVFLEDLADCTNVGTILLFLACGGLSSTGVAAFFKKTSLRLMRFARETHVLVDISPPKKHIAYIWNTCVLYGCKHALLMIDDVSC